MRVAGNPMKLFGIDIARVFRRRKQPKLFPVQPSLAGAVSRVRYRPRCSCFEPHYVQEKKWSELSLHTDVQDVNCDGWKRLKDLIERAVQEEWEVFEPEAHMDWDDWAEIVTLPREIGKLKSVKELRLYSSFLVRVPPEIGDMSGLKTFIPYTSYRLHWFPYEITRCKKLKDSTVSTRALYGNFKIRPPFPRLPSIHDDMTPDCCSVCRGPFGKWGPQQRWISLRVATDVPPLLVHACSRACIENLPAPAENYIPRPHKGSIGLAQPKPRP